MKILKILFSCFVVLVLSAFFVFELIFARSVDNSLSAYAEENITSDFVEPLSGDDPDPSIIDYHWDLSGFDQYNLNLFYIPDLVNGTSFDISYSFSSGVVILKSGTSGGVTDVVLMGSWNSGINLFPSFFGKSFTISAEGLNSGYFQIKAYYKGNWVFGIPFGSTYSNFVMPEVDFIAIEIPKDVSVSNNVVYPMLLEGTYTAETMPAYQPNLKSIFTTGFTNGYRDGYDTGYDSGRNYGYNLGYSRGYDVGYSYGRNSQISEGLFKNPLDVFLQPISNFLNTDIFGSFSIGDGFTIAFFVMIALIFIKMFAGG